jgi:hypothetical protein
MNRLAETLKNSASCLACVAADAFSVDDVGHVALEGNRFREAAMGDMRYKMIVMPRVLGSPCSS